MAKPKTLFYCSECGAGASKWGGQCSGCEAWNTLVEAPAERAAAGAGGRSVGWAGGAVSAEITPLASLSQAEEVRISVGIAELDRVLGGGLVQGSVVLVGGDPGIG